MGSALEPLFETYAVDLALWGHVHNYERSCALHNQTCHPPSVKSRIGNSSSSSSSKGTVHVTAGTGGASVSAQCCNAHLFICFHNKKYGTVAVYVDLPNRVAAALQVTMFPTLNKTSGQWTTRTCVANTSKWGKNCPLCKDVTSCAATGHLPCAGMRCAPPPAWSVVRSEEHGYVRIGAEMEKLTVDFIAVATDEIGSRGTVKDSFVLLRRY